MGAGMQDGAEYDASAWSGGVESVLNELQTRCQDRADSALDCALLAVREAVDTWHVQIQQLAAHERTVQDTRSLEQRARQRVCVILDLATQLAALPIQPTSSAPVRLCGERATEAGGVSGSDGQRSPPAGLALFLLGSFELQVAGRRVTDWRGRRGPAVLQFLASRRPGFVDREVLIEAVWPGISPDLGRHRLHQAIYALRQTLHQLDPDQEHIVCENGAYRLHPRVRMWIDVEKFERFAADGAKLEAAGHMDEAIDAYRSASLLYRGDFLESNPFADWAAAERRRFRASYVVIGNRLGELYVQRGDHAAALAVCLKVLERDGWNEEVTRNAMRSYAATGNRSMALQLFKSLEADLANEFGLAPSVETCTLHMEIRSPTLCDAPSTQR